MRASADRAVQKEGGTGFSMADRGSHEAALLEFGYVLIRRSCFDDTRARGVERSPGEPVVGMHPIFEIGDDALREQLHGRLAHPVVFGVMGVAVVARSGYDMNTGCLRDRPHPGRPPSAADGCHLNDRVQPAALRVAHLFDRATGVVELLTGKGRRTQKQMVVCVGHAKLLGCNGPENRHDHSLRHSSQGLARHGWHYKRRVRGGRAARALTSFHLGLDLGGTNLKWVVLERDGSAQRVLTTGRVHTNTSQGERSVVRQLIQVARAASSDQGLIDSIGVGVPGLYDPVTGSTRFLPNVPGKWAGMPVAAEVSEALRAPTRLINDARAFTLAEHRLGAGRGAGAVLGITLGTGVGGGLIIGGNLYLGHDGTAGEFGHQTILPDGPLCTCGNRGCLETLARADAIAGACGQATVEEAVAAARAGDLRAQQGFRDVGRYLGIGASNVVVLVSVDRIVIGGGVAAAGEMLLDPIRHELRRRVHVTDVARIK